MPAVGRVGGRCSLGRREGRLCISVIEAMVGCDIALRLLIAAILWYVSSLTRILKASELTVVQVGSGSCVVTVPTWKTWRETWTRMGYESCSVEFAGVDFIFREFRDTITLLEYLD